MNKFLIIIVLCLLNLSVIQAWNFPPIPDLVKSAKEDSYNPQTLYNIINGGADLYLLYDFVEMRTTDYMVKDDIYINIQVYEHKTGVDAFGIYTQERPTKIVNNFIGAQSYQENEILNFFTGKFYVKIRSNDNSIETQKSEYEVAKALANELGCGEGIPGIFSDFPKENRVENSEQYISKNFLGTPFLSHAYTCDYSVGETQSKLFVLKNKDQNESVLLAKQYFKSIKAKKKAMPDVFMEVKDEYNGKIFLIICKRYIIGCSGTEDSDKSKISIMLLYEKLKQE